MWKGSPVSSNFSVELCRFIPRSAAQTAVASVAAPHQMRSRSPSECGSRRSRPGGLGNIGRGFGWAKPAPPSRARKSSAWRRAMSASVSPSAGAWPKWRKPSITCSGEPRLMPSCSRPPAMRSAAPGVLGHVERVLVAHVDDRRADLDARACARRWRRAAGTARRAAGRNDGPGHRRRRRRAPRPRPRARSTGAGRRWPSACPTRAPATSGRTTGTRSSSRPHPAVAAARTLCPSAAVARFSGDGACPPGACRITMATAYGCHRSPPGERLVRRHWGERHDS